MIKTGIVGRMNTRFDCISKGLQDFTGLQDFSKVHLKIFSLVLCRTNEMYNTDNNQPISLYKDILVCMFAKNNS